MDDEELQAVFGNAWNLGIILGLLTILFIFCPLAEEFL